MEKSLEARFTNCDTENGEAASHNNLHPSVMGRDLKNLPPPMPSAAF
jgi:hypothetical protein